MFCVPRREEKKETRGENMDKKIIENRGSYGRTHRTQRTYVICIHMFEPKETTYCTTDYTSYKVYGIHTMFLTAVKDVSSR